MDSSQIAGFWAVALMLTLTPGADWAYAIGVGAQGRLIVPSIAGMLAGYGVVISVVSVGLGQVVVANRGIMLALTLAGSAYLFWNGYRGLGKGKALSIENLTAEQSWFGNFARGAGITSINPAGIMLLLVLLPQFAHAGVGLALPVQLALLGCIFLVNAVIVYTALATLSKRVLTRRPTITVVVGRLTSVAMIALSVVMAAKQLLA